MYSIADAYFGWDLTKFDSKLSGFFRELSFNDNEEDIIHAPYSGNLYEPVCVGRHLVSICPADEKFPLTKSVGLCEPLTTDEISKVIARCRDFISSIKDPSTELHLFMKEWIEDEEEAELSQDDFEEAFNHIEMTPPEYFITWSTS